MNKLFLVSFLGPSAAHRLQQLHHSSNKLKQCSSIWGAETAGVAQKNFRETASRLCSISSHRRIKSRLMRFLPPSSLSLSGNRWMWAQQKKRKKEQGKGPIHFYYFLLRCVKPMCLYELELCAQPTGGTFRPLHAN